MYASSQMSDVRAILWDTSSAPGKLHINTIAYCLFDYPGFSVLVIHIKLGANTCPRYSIESHPLLIRHRDDTLSALSKLIDNQ